VLYQDLYDAKYKSIRARGWSGWGSVDREELGKVLLERIRCNVHIPHSGRGLELGCGEGQLSRKLSEIGYEMWGVDISEVALSWAKDKNSRGNVKYFQQDLTEENAVLMGRYSLIVDGHCLHCIPPDSRQQFYNNVSRALHDTGKFYVSTRCSKSMPRIVEDSGLIYRYFAEVYEVLSELEIYGFRILSKSEFDRGEQVHLDVVAQYD
jgi:SAM-dependent methyltransferase